MVRISDKQIFGAQTQRIARARVETSRLQAQAASGQRVIRPSDDPGSFGRIAGLDHRLAALEGTRQSAARVLSRFEVAEGALGDMESVLERARELTIGGLNGAQSAATRQSTAHEVRALREHMLGLANTKVDGQFIFSGTRTDRPPLADDGTYQGGGAGSPVKIGVGSPIDAAIDGQRFLAGGASVLQTLDRIVAALEGNDPAALGQELDALTGLEDQIIDARTDLGARIGRVRMSEALAEEVTFELTRQRAGEADADMASVISQLVGQEQALQAAVQIAGRSMQTSLLDILR